MNYSWSHLYSQSRKNAERRGIPFLLSRQAFDDLVARADGRCMVSGIPFDFAHLPGSTRRPYAASLDRIDSRKGYTDRNVRLVCVLVNVALNEWGLDPLLKVAYGLVAHEAELRRQQSTGSRYGVFEFVTVKAYADERGLPLTPMCQSQLTKAARRLCDMESLEYTEVVCQGPLRKDGTHRPILRWAFPRSVLERAMSALHLV